MRVNEIVRRGVPCFLFHPSIGPVAWTEPSPGEGLRLVFNGSIDRGKDLCVDEAVLFDDRWQEAQGSLGPLELPVKVWLEKLPPGADGSNKPT